MCKTTEEIPRPLQRQMPSIKKTEPRNLHKTYKKSTIKTNEVLIDGYWYNFKDFKHPGGRLIQLYDGEDGTQAFNEFHQKSKKARLILKKLPKRKAESTELAVADPLVKDFCELRDQLEKEGFFKPDSTHIVFRIIELCVMHILGFYIYKLGGLFNQVAAILILGVAQGRCGWLQHEAGHYSLSGNVKFDYILQLVFNGVGTGCSATSWRNQHNKHHAVTQRLDGDPDLNTMPLIAFTRAKFSKIKGGLRWWIQNQAWLFVPVINPMVAMGWQFYLHPLASFKSGNIPELAMFLIRFMIIGYVMFCEGLVKGWLLFLAYNWVGSNYLFLNFSVSHTHLPTIEKGKTTDWVRYAGNHTMNVEPGPFGFVNWWMSFLNFQIEHHLFPTMPQVKHPEVSVRVRKLFEKHGLEYQCIGYWSAMYKTFANLNKIGEEVDEDFFLG